jgi:uncharacterized protein (TIGR00645 family)
MRQKRHGAAKVPTLPLARIFAASLHGERKHAPTVNRLLSDTEMKSLELLVERIILSSRWLLVVFYLGLVAALAVYAFSFALKFLKVAKNVFIYDESDMILAMLGLIDAALVASLIVMVMISGYENFVSRFDNADDEVSFLGKLDAGSLKIKVASSIVAISSIHLLQIFLNANQYSDSKLMWFTIIHLAFVVSAVMLGFLEKLMAKPKDKSEKPAL